MLFIKKYLMPAIYKEGTVLGTTDSVYKKKKILVIIAEVKIVLFEY